MCQFWILNCGLCSCVRAQLDSTSDLLGLWSDLGKVWPSRLIVHIMTKSQMEQLFQLAKNPWIPSLFLDRLLVSVTNIKDCEEIEDLIALLGKEINETNWAKSPTHNQPSSDALMTSLSTTGSPKNSKFGGSVVLISFSHPSLLTDFLQKATTPHFPTPNRFQNVMWLLPEQFQTNYNKKSDVLNILQPFNTGEEQSTEWINKNDLDVFVSYRISINGTGTMTLYEGLPPLTMQVGWWNSEQGFYSVPGISDIGIRQSLNALNGAHLRVAHLPWPPFIIFPETGCNSTKAIGFLPDIMKILSSFLNFTYEYMSPPDREWGGMDENNSWNGIVRMLKDRVCHLAAAPLSITIERAKVIDFGNPFYLDELSLFGYDHKAINISGYLSIFHPVLWISLFILILVLALYFHGLSRLQLEQFHSTQQNLSLGNALAVVLICFLQRDYPKLRILTVYGRALYLTTCLSSFMVFVFFCAGLTSHMTVHTDGNQITSLDDVLEYKMQMIILGTTSEAERLKHAEPGSTLHTIYQQTMVNKPETQLKSIEEVHRLLEYDPKNVYFGLKTSLHGLTRIKAHPLTKAFSVPFAFGFEKNSRLTRWFDYHMMKMGESGLIDNLLHKWWPQESMYEEEQSNMLISLDYAHLVFPFGVLMLGVIMSFAVIVLERKWRHVK